MVLDLHSDEAEIIARALKAACDADGPTGALLELHELRAKVDREIARDKELCEFKERRDALHAEIDALTRAYEDAEG
jgi:hypothetical protein